MNWAACLPEENPLQVRYLKSDWPLTAPFRKALMATTSVRSGDARRKNGEPEGSPLANFAWVD
jgi:hypothetical protein